MRITFVSNYINHHQIPLSNTLYEALGEEYHFIQTQPMEEERILMGWKDEHSKIPYLKLLYEEEAVCKELIANSDVVIFGWSDESLITKRIEQGKLTFRYSERIYKEGQWRAISPRGLIQKYKDHIRYRKKPLYLLCAGAYVASDFHLLRAYPDKMFRWGYFPECNIYDMDQLLSGKNTQDGLTNILWAGRMIYWKHVELLIPLAAYLKEKGYSFKITVVGDGEKRENLEKEIEEKGLKDCFCFKGFLGPKEVRKEMEKAHIYLPTSDCREGWGAVVNEAMNSACCVVASHEMGAVPYLVKHNENGLIFQSKNEKDLCEKVEKLLENPAKREEMAKKAYETIVNEWNAKVAGERLLKVCEEMLDGKTSFYTHGPCSKAPIFTPKKCIRSIQK